MNRSARFYLMGEITMIMIVMATVLSSCKKDDPKPVDPDKPFERLLENQILTSAILKSAVTYSVLLPAEYATSTDSYPVVYLLHGYGDTETAWYKAGNIQYYADRYPTEVVPMIYVMPRAGNRYYVNKFNGNYPFMDMFVGELVPEIDSIYRTKKDKSQRAVMGYSMGGYGALVLPTLHPETFSISVPLSMSFRTDEQYATESQESFNSQWAPNFGGSGAVGTERLTDYFIGHSPFHYFATTPPSAFSDVKILMDCGDDEEQLQHTNDALHDLMRDNAIPHEYRVRDGGHSWDYWKKSLHEGLAFISDGVSGIQHPVNPTPVDVGSLISEDDVDVADISGNSVSILTPPPYADNTTTLYPVLYFIYEAEEGKESAQRLELLSLLRNNMVLGNLDKAVIVAVPQNGALGQDAMEAIITYAQDTYRTKPVNESRALMGNGAGGLQAAHLLSDTESFNAGFLYNADLPAEGVDPSASVYYYLDATTSTNGYKGYHAMFVAIRDLDSPYQYRVRQGDTSWQSVLNGVAQSFGSINEKLK